jgi:phage terminase small subunit
MTKNETPTASPSKKLTPKERLFVKEYLIDLNASAACRRAGFQTKRPNEYAATLLTKPNISAALTFELAEREKRTEITGDMVIKELALIGFQNVQQLYDDEGQFIPIHKLPEQVARTVAGVEFTEGEERLTKVKTWDKKGALEQLGRHFKLFTDVSESTNTNTVSLTDTETAAKILSLIETLTQRAAKDDKA